MNEQNQAALQQEITHIFESGANEVRIFEMVKNFIEKRYSENKRHNPSAELMKEAHHFISRFGKHTKEAIAKVRNGALYSPLYDELFDTVEYILQEKIINPLLCNCENSTVKIDESSKYICQTCHQPIY